MKLHLPLANRFNHFYLNPRHHELFFLYGSNKFKFVDDPNIADCIPVDPDRPDEVLPYLLDTVTDRNKIILIVQDTHIAEGDDYLHCSDRLIKYQQYYKNTFFITQNRSLKDYQSIIFNDFCFNRQKAYFTDYENYDMTDRLFSGTSSKSMYALNPIKKLESVTKRFLIPNNIYVHNQREYHSPRIKARILIRNLCNDDDCYFTSDSKILDTEETTERLQEILNNSKQGWGFMPVANRYYEDSIISVYGETIAHGKTGVRYVTEKTWNPLIKGHYILPLAYPGIIRDLEQEYGFIFPDWIDYTYDTYIDDDKRFSEFEKSLNKLREMSLQELLHLRNRDIAILEHNRNIFYTKSYDVFYDRLQEKLAGLIQR